ncbi:MAG: iron-regulated protein [Chloroflexota bacterium]|nr:iron-regulated protein [Chloroflexota bacterium]MDE2910597.1 iron-regulated protein [Chloroflexota bacterium]
MKRLSLLVLIAALAIWAGSASADENLAALQQDAVETYADIVFASYQDSLELAVALNEALIAFVSMPDESTLAAARDAWLASNEPYGQTEAYRFYGGPIDDEDGPEGLLNAWPLDEAYIDYVDGDADAGIINNTADYPEITKDLLISLNEVGAEENISTGYHAIEFLLWGQDLYEDSAGKRPATDYSSAPNAERRGQYLLITGELLVENLQDMVDQWNHEIDDNYVWDFHDGPTDVALTNMLTGIGVLAKSELAGERMFTAYDNQDQEDEHSCFSDNTHRDIITNFMGVSNVYRGAYTRIDGTVVEGAGLADLFEALAPELNAEMLELLDLADQQVNGIFVPFDRAIVNADSRPGVFDAVFTLQDVGDKLVELAVSLDLVIDTALPE